MTILRKSSITISENNFIDNFQTSANNPYPAGAANLETLRSLEIATPDGDELESVVNIDVRQDEEDAEDESADEEEHLARPVRLVSLEDPSVSSSGLPFEASQDESQSCQVVN